MASARFHIAIVILTTLAGIYMLASDFLTFNFLGQASAHRPRILISGTLLFSSVCFLLGMRQRDGWKFYLLGYAAIGMAAFILWLILYGMRI